LESEELERMAGFEEWYWWHVARQSIVRRMLRRYAPPRARMLDVGCGTGATTAALANLGTISGIDRGPAALRHARARGLAVALGSAENLPARSAAFDVVVALDVLEHLDDDRRALLEIRRVLRPGGILVSTVPAYAFLWSSHDEALGHRRRYRRPQLRERLRSAGFEIALCSYIMGSILPVAIVVRLADRLLRRGRSARSDYPALPRVLNTALARVVGLGGVLAPFVPLPFGLSIISVARRPAAAAADNAGGS
jgi:SAM-dependent methyltransferase